MGYLPPCGRHQPPEIRLLLRQLRLLGGAEGDGVRTEYQILFPSWLFQKILLYLLRVYYIIAFLVSMLWRKNGLY